MHATRVRLTRSPLLLALDWWGNGKTNNKNNEPGSEIHNHRTYMAGENPFANNDGIDGAQDYQP